MSAQSAADGGGRFPACLAFALAREGFWSNDPRDAGHETMEGITLASYRAWVGDPGVTPEALRAVTPETVRAFYAAGYWQPVHAELLPAGVDLMAFDFGINASVRRSAMLLQQAVGAAADGWIGPGTLAAVHKVPVAELIGTLATMQDHYYRGCGGFPTFGRGWLSRLAQRKATALSAAGATQRIRMANCAGPPTVLQA